MSEISARNAHRVPDLSTTAWVILLGVVSIGYLLVSVALSTNFFFANGGPTISPVAVWGGVVIFAVQALLVSMRSRPLVMFIAIYVCFLVAVAVTVDRNLTVSITLLFAVFNLTARTAVRVWMPAVGIATLVDVTIHFALAVPSTPAALYLYLAMVILARVLPTYLVATFAGLFYGALRRQVQLADAYAKVLEEANRAQVAVAIRAERNRMARELHDVAAHHLSGILLQAKAAMRIQANDPKTAAELLESINSEGELTLDNLREVVGLLREEPTGDQPIAQPTLSRLPDLVESVRKTNPHIDLAVVGPIDDLSPATSLACFRIIQESLSNARDHAPSAEVSISIAREQRELVIDVSNTATASPAPAKRHRGPGYGLLGMRERANLLGGSLSSARTADGGWCTHAVIPIPVERRHTA